jgi:tryptophanyl-tRNA synthetase
MGKIYLTGIKPTGEIHLGNYLGAIKPSLDMVNEDDLFLFFIADYHALNSMNREESKLIKSNTYKILATYITCGLDPKKVLFYRQSDISEIFELKTILNNFTPKSLLNLGHAYKSKVNEEGLNNYSNINMGLFNYPSLMASDILAFNSNYIPVGSDQIQHIEIAREIARRFNFNIGKELITLPEAIVKEPEVLIGIDGRKMSKSYQNTIPIFCSEKKLHKLIKSIKTDSTPVDSPKPLNCDIRNIYSKFATEDQLCHFDNKLINGISYGEAKDCLFELINNQLNPMRLHYEQLVTDTKNLDKILLQGKVTVKRISEKNLNKIKKNLIG